MAGFQITITTAGRAALVNAANTGTAPVLVNQVGLTSTAFAPAVGQVALPGEFKRVGTIAGDVVADDTIHVNVKDESADTYTVRGFAVYLQDGTLFGIYGQATPIIEKSAEATLLLGIDVIFADISAALLTFGATNWTNPPATEARQGVVELADDLEIAAGVDGTRAVSPKRLKPLLDAIWAAIGGKSAIGHTHDAADTTSGTFNVARIPNLDAGKITSGVLDVLRIPALTIAKITGLQAALDGKSATGHTHDAADTTSGTFNVARIPNLDAGKITSGILAVLRIPDLDAAKIVSGVLDILRIPDLDAGKTTTGIFNVARIPDLDAGKIVSGIFNVARIPDLDAAKIVSGILNVARIPNLDTAKITTGVFAVARIPDLLISKITGLQAALDGKQPLGNYQAAGDYAAPDLSGLKLLQPTIGVYTVAVTAECVMARRADGVGKAITNLAATLDISTVGLNGRDTAAAISVSSWYYVFAISDGANKGVVASLSPTAPTLPAGYTFSRRIGALRTMPAGTVTPFVQYGRKVRWINYGTGLPAMVSGAVGDVNTPTWSAIPVVNFAPPTAGSVAVYGVTSATNQAVLVAPNNSYGNNGNTTNTPPLKIYDSGNTGIVDILLESASIYVAQSGVNVRTFSAGWDDNL